ncbi:MAG: uracil-DNA glycosylase family protein [Planctomycetota bacterium]
MKTNSKTLIKAARELSKAVDQLVFEPPVTHVYNPLAYARSAHESYLSLVGEDVSIVLLGMNPGPWGMAQTGVPFGEIAAVRDWLGIETQIGKPQNEHPKRPVEGFACSKSEVSGRRLWGLFQERFKTPASFFERHFVLNYCPLVFMEESARNRTPDKLTAEERKSLDAVCDKHLQSVLQVLNPEFAVGVGAYAEKCLARSVEATGSSATVTRILHPSPASPAANKGWAEKASAQLIDAGVWS